MGQRKMTMDEENFDFAGAIEFMGWTTQHDVSNALGIAQPTVSTYLHGAKIPLPVRKLVLKLMAEKRAKM